MNEFDLPQPLEIQSEEQLLGINAELGDQLRNDAVGGKVVRGGIIRTAGYGIGAVATAISSIFMLRYLGVAGFGKYATVMSLITIVSGVTDAGLTTVGNRELALKKTPADRRALLGQLLGIRFLVTPVAVLAAVAFTLIAGYQSDLVLGTVVAGVGIFLVTASSAYALPLAVELRVTAVTLLDLVKQVIPMFVVIALVLIGTKLLPFFAIAIPGGLIALVAAPWIVGRESVSMPTFRVRDWGELLHKILPVAVGTTIAIIYLRILTILMFELTNDYQTGLFSTSVRIIELIVALSWIVFAIALPVLSVANEEDRVRSQFVLQRMIDVGLVFSGGLAVVLCLAAPTVISVIGGAKYAGAVPVLQIQCFSIVAAFVAQACMYAAVAMDMLKGLMAANAIGLVVVVSFGVPLIDRWGATGAASATLIADVATALSYLYIIGRGENRARPTLRHAWKSALAGVSAAGIAVVSGTPVLAQAAIAFVVFFVVVLATRAIPSEVFSALRRPS